MGFLKTFLERRATRSRERGQLAFASELGPCSACGGSVIDHECFMLASVITSRQPNGLEEFESLTSQRRWDELSRLQEWEGSEDEVVLWALRCPSTQEILLKKECDLAELWADSYLIAPPR